MWYALYKLYKLGKTKEETAIMENRKSKILRNTTLLACIALTAGFCFALNMPTTPVAGDGSTNRTGTNFATERQSGIAVDETISENTFFAGGIKIPEQYRDQPNVHITGLGESIYAYCGLENYAENKDMVLLNGRSWRHWDTRPNATIGTLWVRGGETGSCYLGFDFNGTGVLKLPTQTGEGEDLQTIVLKRGFQFINITNEQCENEDAIYKDSPVVDKVVGTLKDNIIFKVKPSGGFEVLIGGTESVEEPSETQYGIVTGEGVNVRSGPGADYEAYGQLTKNTKLTYLGVTEGRWHNVSYNGQSAWILATYFRIEGYEMITTTKPISLDGYKIEIMQNVLLTEDALLIKIPAVVTPAEAWTTALQGETYRYLGEMSERWYKVDYQGNVGWISSACATLTEEYVEITPLNAGWTMDDENDFVDSSDDVSSSEDAESMDSADNTGEVFEESMDTEYASDESMKEDVSSEITSDSATSANDTTTESGLEGNGASFIKASGCTSSLALSTATFACANLAIVAILKRKREN